MINVKAEDVRKSKFVSDEKIENFIRSTSNGFTYFPLTENQKENLIANGFTVEWSESLKEYKISWEK